MSGKIGSKLVKSLRQKRGSMPSETARPETTRPPLPAASEAPLAAEQSVQTGPQEPVASHGVPHPSRIWPD